MAYIINHNIICVVYRRVRLNHKKGIKKLNQSMIKIRLINCRFYSTINQGIKSSRHIDVTLLESRVQSKFWRTGESRHSKRRDVIRGLASGRHCCKDFADDRRHLESVSWNNKKLLKVQWRQQVRGEVRLAGEASTDDDVFVTRVSVKNEVFVRSQLQ